MVALFFCFMDNSVFMEGDFGFYLWFVLAYVEYFQTQLQLL